MSAARERVRSKAREIGASLVDAIAPEGASEVDKDVARACIALGYSAGRTVSAEQIEKAARAITHPDVDPDRMGVTQTYDGGSTDEGWKTWRPTVVTAFTAAGFLIEGDES